MRELTIIEPTITYIYTYIYIYIYIQIAGLLGFMWNFRGLPPQPRLSPGTRRSPKPGWGARVGC